MCSPKRLNFLRRPSQFAFMSSKRRQKSFLLVLEYRCSLLLLLSNLSSFESKQTHQGATPSMYMPSRLLVSSSYYYSHCTQISHAGHIVCCLDSSSCHFTMRGLAETSFPLLSRLAHYLSPMACTRRPPRLQAASPSPAKQPRPAPRHSAHPAAAAAAAGPG